MSTTLLVTGASGHLGRGVVERLLAKGHRVIAATRTPEQIKDLAAKGAEIRRADFDDRASLDAAFRGVDRLLLVSTDALDGVGTRARQHTAAIEAAQRAGVKHVVYTSLLHAKTSTIALAPDHRDTEAALERSTLGYTIVRNSWYAELLLGSLPGALAAGQLFSAARDGRISYISRDDCAEAAAAALASSFEGRRVLENSGPEALAIADVARLAREISGRPLEVVPVSEAQLADGLEKHGLPRPLAALFASIDTSVAGGALSHVTDDHEKLTGRKPATVEAFLNAHRAALAGQ